MRILICGGRDYDDYNFMKMVMDKVVFDHGDHQMSNYTIISGAARGADSLAIRLSHEYGMKLESYPADWTKHGMSAGPIRNQQMLDDGKPDLVVAFPGGVGTADMIRRSKKAGIKVIEVE
jgi:predicted Rossmann-fold nucleotide-binding protein